MFKTQIFELQTRILRAPFGVDRNYFFVTKCFSRTVGLTKSSILYPGICSCIEWQGREGNHASLSDAEGKVDWIYVSILPYTLTSSC
jgi:hypothetical protein